MQWQSLHVAIFFFVIFSTQKAQGQWLQKTISLQIVNLPLEEALRQINQEHGIPFAYSRDFVAVRRKVTIQVQQQRLGNVLRDLLPPLGIEHAEIGGQIMLRAAPPVTTRIEPKKIDPRQTSVVYPPNEEEKKKLEYLALERARQQKLDPLSKAAMSEYVFSEQPPVDYSSDILEERKEVDYELQPNNSYDRFSQISIIPFVGTNALESGLSTNRFSFNLLGGTNGGVNGIEVGGGINNVLMHVEGLQVAGLANWVGGNVNGCQLAGGINLCRYTATGVQMAGLVNVSGTSKALQVAGVGNYTGTFNGLQLAGVANVSEGNNIGWQISSVLNMSEGDITGQAGLGINLARDVSKSQVSLLLNAARNVRRNQFALVNISDTIAGLPIGLFNFVKKGYNRLELSANENMLIQLTAKFGVQRFYNIAQLGARMEPDSRGTISLWTLGYGMGSSSPFGNKALWHIEVVGSHVNERERWTNTLHALGQARTGLSFYPAKRIGLHAFATANGMASKRFTSEAGDWKTDLSRRAIWEQDADGIHYTGWLGFNAGFSVAL